MLANIDSSEVEWSVDVEKDKGEEDDDVYEEEDDVRATNSIIDKEEHIKQIYPFEQKFIRESLFSKTLSPDW